jgi:hypothetical protein
MPIEPVVHTIQTVRPTGEAERERPDGRSSRRDEGRQQHEEHAPHGEAHPVPNDRGQITGKIIDVTA